jgi:beta-catenin-like protein 1
MKRKGDEIGSAEPSKRPAISPEVLSNLLSEGDLIADFDSRQLQITLQTLEKAICRNQESRLRYSDDPLKFQQSEEDLYNAILRFKAVPEEAEMQLVESAGLENLVGLLGHENLDIGNCVLEVVSDWCEGEKPAATAMLDRLCSLELLNALITLLTRLRLSFDSDSEVLYNALSLLECIFTSKSELISGQPAAHLAKWTLEQLETADNVFSTNKLYLVETLASILSQPGNYQAVTELKGVEIVLKTIISHSSCEPEGNDEKEFLANLFDCLSSLLLYSPALAVFRRVEGLSALIQLLR